MKPDITLKELLKIDGASGKDGAMPLRADLHCHSTISDGSFTSAELLAQAQVAGLTHLAITNHDTTAGFDDAHAAAQALSAVPSEGASAITYVSGIEISAWNPKSGRKVHILGYGLQEDSPAIAALCTPTLKARTANTEWQQEQLEKAGYTLDYRRLEQLRNASTGFYKQHLMAALTTAPFTSQEYQTLYKSLFKGEGICKRDITYVSMCDAVRAITEDGGVAVLAHPGQLDSYDAVPELVDAGLWGIEQFHPDHSESDWKLCEEIAQRFDLVCTGGSDFHGDFGEVERLGQCLLSIS